MKKAIVILSVLVVSLCGATVLANPVLLYEVGVSPNQIINITAGAPANYTGDAYAGVYNLMIDFDPNDGVDNYQAFSGYCVDPAFSETSATLYDIIAIPDEAQYQQAAWLFEYFGLPTTADEAAIAQTAIWIVIDGITVNSGPASILAQANAAAALAAAAVSGGWVAPDYYALAVSPASIAGTAGLPDYQDFIIRTPEPASLLLLGLGLIGVGLARRRYQ